MIGVIALVLISGCATTGQKTSAKSVNGSQSLETTNDVQSALQSVAGSLTGQEVSQEDLKKFSEQIQGDKEAKTAVKAVTNAMSGQRCVKYCPVTGKRFSCRLKYCPEHGVLLKKIESE
jgi:hypothetical protein